MEQSHLGQGTTADDSASLARVERVVRSLVRLIHGKKLYAENNPRLAQFAEGLRVDLDDYFESDDRLELSIDQFTIRWRDHIVYENEKREESIAFLLHRDGIGEISIGERAVGPEVELLVQIMADEYHKSAPDDDVVTRFWNADFEHVTYRVLDDYLAGDYTDLMSAGGGDAKESDDHEELLPSLQDRGRVIVRPADPIESIDDYLKKLIMHTCESTDPAAREAYFQSTIGSFFTVSNEEIAIYQKEIEDEQRSDSLADFAEVVFVFTLLKDNPSAVRDVSGVLDRIVEFAVEERNPLTLGRVLTLVRGFRQVPNLPEAIAQLCDTFEGRLTDPSIAERLSEQLGEGKGDPREALDYFRLVGARSVDPLLRLLHHVDGKRLHRDICDTLIDVSGEDIVHVLDRLDIDNAIIAADAVHIIQAIGLSTFTPRMHELLFYPDRKVKEDMIALVAEMDGIDAVELLLLSMVDDDKHVRCRAMEAASRTRDDRVRERLAELAFGGTLNEYDADEQEVMFKALGQVGNEQTVEHLGRFVEKRSLVNFGRNRENKFLAIRALERIQHPSALQLLDQLGNDTNNLVQSRARRAHEMLASSMARSSGETEK